MRLRRRLLACTLAGTTALTACTSSSGETDDADPTGGTSSSGAPVESTSTASTPPPLPDEATGDDDAAAIAFVEHWVELVNYAFLTGVGDSARALAPGCENCAAAIDNIESTFGDAEPGSWTVDGGETFDPQAPDRATTDVVVLMNVEIADNVIEDPAITGTGTLTFGLKRTDGSWEVSWLDAATAA
ncbi:hypothetical protein INN71_13330 [Nocardioides sp. ChNu-153]|uniref:DUF6318 family protein n=1 Tax=unclassified Nocardioides TaxID=2615069 RepID=UPI0024055232|nr:MULTISPECIES: DUF6318 family protein [unclassified Nocardioides]MDF9715102.1 hypothetical protein [Nocardioides sp. ChNu-99]MDN7122372.1 hypothetical protein [Nocardioides sp. ChNu-153]